ncbi:hypothetical protein MMC21_007491 [Puttea exsequens]|nr:hypothetical protein [Puttea exsequens]
MADNNDDVKLYHYNPSVVAAVIFIVLFACTTGLHTYQFIRTRTWIMIPLLIGGFMEVIGYVCRTINSQEDAPDWSLGPFIVQAVVLLIAPTLFTATIYMILGRIILLVDG